VLGRDLGLKKKPDGAWESGRGPTSCGAWLRGNSWLSANKSEGPAVVPQANWRLLTGLEKLSKARPEAVPKRPPIARGRARRPKPGLLTHDQLRACSKRSGPPNKPFCWRASPRTPAPSDDFSQVPRESSRHNSRRTRIKRSAGPPSHLQVASWLDRCMGGEKGQAPLAAGQIPG